MKRITDIKKLKRLTLYPIYINDKFTEKNTKLIIYEGSVYLISSKIEYGHVPPVYGFEKSGECSAYWQSLYSFRLFHKSNIYKIYCNIDSNTFKHLEFL